MTIERPMFPPREIETIEPFAVQDVFCEALLRIERIGPCRRLVFVVSDNSGRQPLNAVIAKLVLPAEAMAELSQMASADKPELGFGRTPISAVAN